MQKNTFSSYQPTLGERLVQVWGMTLVATSLVGFGLLFWFSYRYYALKNRSKELGTIVTEYIPPSKTSVLLAEQIGDGTRSGFTAQVIDLAVRHYLRLYQTKEKTFFSGAEYELEIIKSIDDLSQEEKTFLETLFGDNNTTVGSKFEMKKLKNNYSVSKKFTKNTKSLEALIAGDYGLRHQVKPESAWFKKAGFVTLAIGLVTLSPFMLVAAIIAFTSASQLRPLTDAGLQLRRYLEGLKRYIKVAEEERLKLLQSPKGAEKSGVSSVDNTKQLVKLYERTLPYAVLFGQEKQWNKQLGDYYEQSATQPDWYSGNAAFNAVVFSSAMSDFSTTTNSYGASTSSSSSGSSGGGSSGGGGGGGGGGGW